jgi:hypothetical protein
LNGHTSFLLAVADLMNGGQRRRNRAHQSQGAAGRNQVASGAELVARRMQGFSAGLRLPSITEQLRLPAFEH